MKLKRKFYITTAIDYTNDTIHIGHIYQKVIADVLARYHRMIGDKVFFLTGIDEHGGKVEEAAAQAGFADKEKEFVDQIALSDKKEQESIGISFDRFIRTTDPDHVDFCLEFWKKVERSGDIYQGDYDGVYCGGCEGYLTKSDLKDNKCPYHPNQELKIIKEKNYFFRWSKYTNFLREHINSHQEFIWPDYRRNEMLSFIEQGIQDIPISRSNIKWGIPVPNDPTQTIYVWFDALINYLSGAPEGFWPANIHILGKDNTRWHALFWPAMLKSAGFELPKTILVNGFLSLNGQKISKSLGNIIRTSELVEQFGADAIRYYLLKSKPIDTDGDISLNKIKEIYNADLANGLGNLVQRIARLCDIKGYSPQVPLATSLCNPLENAGYKTHLEKIELNLALEEIWRQIKLTDALVNQERLWEKSKEKVKIGLKDAVRNLVDIAYALKPFLPQTAEKIESIFRPNKNISKITPEESLFPKIN